MRQFNRNLKRTSEPFHLVNGKPALILAPMEGLTDAPMRACLTELGGFSLCVSEFLRVSQQIPPSRVFLRHIPELREGAKTPAAVPVQIQLLGGDPEKLAASALRAVWLGAPAIDLNFGCPAPTVNKHDGGATLLKYPARLRGIVEAVRRAVPSDIAVSAKLRLGWEDPSDIHFLADSAAEGGATWITIHGRTRLQGYGPPADWKAIGEVRRRLKIPVVANGDIRSREDFLRCQEMTECEHFMLGRGAVARPWLAAVLAANESDETSRKSELRWNRLLDRFAFFADSRKATHLPKRMKQWLSLAHKFGDFTGFDDVKRLETAEAIRNKLGELTCFG